MSVSMRYGSGGGVREMGGASSISDLLWENQSPDSNFSAQTISLDLTPYNAVIVEFLRITTDTQTKAVLVMDFEDDKQSVVEFLTGMTTTATAAINVRSRTFTVSTTGIAFDDALTKSTNATGGASTSNGYVIPVLIYGVNF